MADAPDLGSGGQPWGFKSLHPHHSYKTLERSRFFCFCQKYYWEKIAPINDGGDELGTKSSNRLFFGVELVEFVRKVPAYLLCNVCIDVGGGLMLLVSQALLDCFQ